MSAEELPLSPDSTPGLPVDNSALGPTGLTLVSVSRDGTRMLFVDQTGQEFTVEVDERLRAALPADSTRRSEPPVTDSRPTASAPSLRPRDIQNRIRGGESAEDVAAAAGTTVEKIMAFAGPVLAEREHMAERAQKASVRRRPGEPASSVRVLGQAVAQHLSNLMASVDDVVWDSYRRPDGKWKLSATFDTKERSGIAELTYDVPGNYVSLDNEDAHWLVGDAIAPPAPPAPAMDDLAAARQRRAAAPETQVEATQADVSPTEDTIEQPLEPETPVEAYLFDSPTPQPKKRSSKGRPTMPAIEPKDQPESKPEAPAAEEKPAEQPKPKRSTRRKRASVPSWDEIMFGGSSGKES